MADPKGKSRPSTTNDGITSNTTTTPSKPVSKDDSGLRQSDFPHDSPLLHNRPSEAEDVLNSRKSKSNEPTVSLDLDSTNEPQASPAIGRAKSPMSLLKREQSEVPNNSPGQLRKKIGDSKEATPKKVDSKEITPKQVKRESTNGSGQPPSSQ